jgi:predicted Zn-dependent protease
MSHKGPIRKCSVGLPLVAAVLVGCASVENPVTGEREYSVMSESDEIAEGKKAHEQVLAEYGAYKDAKLQAYVNDVGQRLAKQSHRSNLEWQFTVLDSPEINAFALPGGYVYVTRGIMAYMDSEADLAGVMGHEIGHVTARHGAQRATRQQSAGIGVLAATVLGVLLETQGVSGAGQMASQVSQNVAAGYIASYSRDQELQADKLGAEYLARVKYNPRNMVDVIQLLKNQETFAAEQAKAEGKPPPQQPNWLASHPTNEQRLRDITQIASQYQGNYTDDGRERFMQAISGMAFGESQEQGITRGRNFYHAPLGIAITAPVGWKIQNSAEALVLVNPEGTAGLVMRAVPPKAGSTHEEILRNVVKPDSGRTEHRTLNGLQATHFSGTRKNAQGQSAPAEVTVASGPQNRNYLFAYAAKSSQALRASYPQMQEAEASFRPMNAADRKAAQPWEIRTVAFPRGGFAELAKQSPLTTHAEQHLKLLNGVYAGGEIKPGQPVKVVVAH